MRAHCAQGWGKAKPQTPRFGGFSPCARLRLLSLCIGCGSKRAQQAQRAQQGRDASAYASAGLGMRAQCERKVVTGAKRGGKMERMSETQQAATEKSSVNGRKVHYSPHGVRTPGGRPKGVRNRLTNIRDAVIEAFDTVGGPAYLVKLANGTQSDRAAFVGLMAKVLPTQIQANIDGGIRIELGWLGGRSVGATAAQIADDKSQVIDLQRDSDGVLRIKDPIEHEQPANPTAEKPDPHPPIEPGEGG